MPFGVCRRFFYSMKITKLFLAFLIGLLLCVPLHQADAQQTVTIPDANLKAAINEAIDSTRNAEADVMQTDMRKLTELTVKATRDWSTPPYPVVNEVTDLTGLEHATSLTTLTITNNRVPPDDQLNAAKLGPILNLPLETLNLGYNNIQDLTPLQRLTSLKHLNLEQNKISDISPLASLSALERLNLWSNPITDISIFASAPFPKLEFLNIQDTWVRDFSPLHPDHWVMKYSADR